MEIKELKIYSNNINDQEQFYGHILGFPYKRISPDRLEIYTLENKLILERSDKQFVYHFAFLIPTDCLDGAIRFLEEKGIELLPFQNKKIIDFKSGQAIYFYDKDGNIAEFIERPTLPYPSKKDFDINDVIKINEIGLPVNDPMAMAEHLVERFNIIPNNRSGFSDHFCWVGDWNGVIIVVQEGRDWLPTKIPGVINDFSLIFEDQGNTHQLEFVQNEIKDLSQS